MAGKGQDIAAVIKKQIENFGSDLTLVDVGTVIEVGDGVARIHGLSGVSYSELLEFEGGITGLAMNLEEDSVGAVILEDPLSVKEGSEVRSTGKIIEVSVGEKLIGRVVDSLGQPIDGKGPTGTTETMPAEIVAPDVASRSPVNTPASTGIKAVDGMIPIGRGQRELIIGDRSTGKSMIAVDTIINQKGGDLTCVYVAIGQKASKVAQTVAMLEKHGAMEHTIVVAANAADPAALQYLAPYAGCAMAEHFMNQGKDALIVYDDLTKHAWAYRQMSLLLRRPPGREAYPGDVFYLHSRLLERAAKLDEASGGGSITALPIIETTAGDVSAYVPTNVISITDGQIYLESELFNSGIRPAINAGLSVSRVGGAAQTKAMKSVAGGLRIQLAQYRELATFAQFGTEDLDEATRSQLARGQRAVEILKQDQNKPLSSAEQVIVMYALSNGYLDGVEVDKIQEAEGSLNSFMQSSHTDIINTINDSGELGDDVSKKLNKALEEFKKTIVG
ncbi:MAG: F-type H+-transporting ATPase subunit alpha [Chloroflexi bacterium]|jgi:F-type H+-transporting ATPase subunit alpha|nr:MAG: F-type H+-transporting ATPase subunit alpha [Chloroflexota bacterium]